jgi:hypothetical protein
MGPLADDLAHDQLYSEVGPPETVTVADRRTVLFDHRGRPLTRKAGF